MKVILRQDVPDVGAAGQTGEGKTGFGRNYLIPRNLAIPATKASLRAIDEIRKQTEIREKKARREAEVVKDRIEKVSLTHEVLVGEDDRLYGSVTNADIAERLAAEGITVDKRAIQLDTPIKVLGIYTVPVKIAKDVTANLKLVVVKKSE